MAGGRKTRKQAGHMSASDPSMLPEPFLQVGGRPHMNLAPAVAQAPKKAVASPALQKEFDGFIEKFRAALRTNDSAAVAGMTRLPFMNDSAIRDAAQFRAKTYPTSFTAKNRACIQRGKAVYDRNQENNDNYFVFCGELIFVFTKTPAGFLFTEVGAND
ncbi:hypothetical protein HAP41_0000020425 [Bradyrhizobium barranii subsp. apii]|uniref:Uncharacterized protein n=1 Tax=Bradyrhizobium barranii subsp. apii TaxID=2819348 RepID=A0A8T5VIZ7_9BRAD|nr:hypothetical protein [Bradyrhizobium barranii]UPT91081.1 hypothetical protein HAP41_0000020425 [Bradyrhizobium barranii subsp. apii]UPT93575.1 hypothetical protein J4G48_0030010 [Bradyrhizobium barranii subsp. apii]